MLPDLSVDLEALHRAAAALAAIAARVSDGSRTDPRPDTTPRWTTSDAARGAADAARQQLARLGADIAGAAHNIDTCATEYEAADDRVAGRLRTLR